MGTRPTRSWATQTERNERSGKERRAQERAEQDVGEEGCCFFAFGELYIHTYIHFWMFWLV